MNQPSSSDFDWDLARPERTIELLEIFDVQQAKKFIAQVPRPIGSQSLEGRYREYFQSYLEDVRFRQNADCEKVDTNVPVIFGVDTDGKKIPLDGRHRIAKALKDNLPAIPVVCLTPTETEAIRSGTRI
jgi:hypothetical protein